jgi:hypothetical protein
MMKTSADNNNLEAPDNNKKVYAIVAHMTSEDKRRFMSLAADEGIPPAIILRNLIRHVLKGHLSLFEIMKKNGEISAGRAEIKTRLSDREKRELLSLSVKWDVMPGTLVRCLVGFYLSQVKEKSAI